MSEKYMYMYVFKIKWNSYYLKFLTETLYIFKKIFTCLSLHYHLLSVVCPSFHRFTLLHTVIRHSPCVHVIGELCWFITVNHAKMYKSRISAKHICISFFSMKEGCMNIQLLRLSFGDVRIFTDLPVTLKNK